MHTRRDIIATAAIAGTALYASTSKAAVTSSPPPAAAKDPFAETAGTSATCVRTGEACVAHCIDELGKGNTAMANCNVRVHEMLAMVKAMLTLTSLKSDLAKRTAAVCADACKACAAACFEHKDHWAHGMHLACKDCYDACIACEKSCRALAGA